MARPSKSNGSAKDSTANLGFEAKLWLAADKLRNNMDAAATERSDKRRPWPEPYKHVVRGLNRTQSRTLATLRDTLLPKLLSRELSVAALESGLAENAAATVKESLSVQTKEPKS